MSKYEITMALSSCSIDFSEFASVIESFGERFDLSPKVVFNLTLVIDELVTNVVSYGYTDCDEHVITLKLEMGDDNTLQVEIRDDGVPFNILEAPPPELDVPLEERKKQVGGMGIHLVRCMMDDIAYERQDGYNVLILKKNLDSESDCSTTARPKE